VSSFPVTGSSVTDTLFHSILFGHSRDLVNLDRREEPPFFGDLNLDQMLDAITTGRLQYDLAPFFYSPLRDVEAVQYRHHVLRDLEQAKVLDAVRAFAEGMGQMRGHLALADKLHHHYQRQRWFLEAATAYCDVVRSLSGQLDAVELGSRGFVGLRGYLSSYTQSDAFTSFESEAHAVTNELAAVRYAIQIKGNRVRVSGYEGEPDMSAEVEQTFAKFKRGAVNDYRRRFRDYAEMNHVEAQILDLVARLHPSTFARLDQFCERHERYLDDTINRFDREVQFYLAYLDYVEPLKARGLPFCYPRVSARSKEVFARDAFDLALASKLAGQDVTVVCNDLELAGVERVLVVTGPNQGGKTTFARMFGQLDYLASLGLPVPAREARLFLADRLFTHFEREEDLRTLRGRFEDELVRIHEILRHATADSVLIMNESFASTTLEDAITVGSEVVRQIIELDALCVYVTFIDELASLGESTVSMTSTVAPEDPAVRTYKIVRRPADGLAYAAAIATKYGLTYESLRRRIVQ
jgi:DNA mismatch repair protein MutS